MTTYEFRKKLSELLKLFMIGSEGTGTITRIKVLVIVLGLLKEISSNNKKINL